ncbi:MAG: GGDEF domain-containing protein [Vicinamibacteria bacterium]
MSLIRVLDQSEQVKIDVEQCAEDLATVNSQLKKGLGEGPLRPGVGNALQKSKLVESKVEEAVEDLTSLNQALKDEVKERVVLEKELIDVKQQERAARHASLYDPLTSLPNRGLFDDRLEQAIAQAKRNSRTLAVMFIELLDRQSLGSEQDDVWSDKVLRSIVSKFETITRDDDTLTRHGNREFLYLRTELTNEANATEVAEEMVQVLSSSVRVNNKVAARWAELKPCIGIAVYPRDGETAAELVGRADDARHRAKLAGKGHSYAR